METQGREIHIDSDKARAGSTNHVVRYVLGIGLALVVLAFAVIVIVGASGANHENNGVDDSARAAAEAKRENTNLGPGGQ